MTGYSILFAINVFIIFIDENSLSGECQFICFVVVLVNIIDLYVYVLHDIGLISTNGP